MVSAAEQLAANLNFPAFAQAEELKKRLWFTLGALLVYRFGTYIPLPGIDPSAWDQIFRSQAGGILGMFNMFSGGGIHRMAIFALNIMPYISASIIIQLVTTVSPTLEALKKEGERGRKIMNQYTRYLTVVLAAFQSYGIAIGLEGAGHVVTDPGWFFRVSTVITLTGGTLFLMWLGEQITARGIGNGISLIIMSGIIAELPSAIAGTLELGRQGALSTGLILAVLVMAVGVIAFIVFMERAQRRLLIQYPRRQVVDNRTFESQSSHLPLKLNTSGVIPPIFASSLILLPRRSPTSTPDKVRPGSARSPFSSATVDRFSRCSTLHSSSSLPSSTRRSCSIRRRRRKTSRNMVASSPAFGRASARQSTSTACLHASPCWARPISRSSPWCRKCLSLMRRYRSISAEHPC